MSVSVAEKENVVQFLNELVAFVEMPEAFSVEIAKTLYAYASGVKGDADIAELSKLLGDTIADGRITKEEIQSIHRYTSRLRAKLHGLVYGVEDKPPFFEGLFAAAQHLLAVFVGIITPPILVCTALNASAGVTAFMISMALFASGICTFIQCHKLGPFGAKLLCVQGTSFQFIAPMIAIGLLAQKQPGVANPESVTWGLPMIFGCCLCAAPAEMVAAFVFKRLKKVITPLVSGIVVTLIGLALIKVGVIACAGGFTAMGEGAAILFGSWRHFAVSGTVMLSIVLLNISSNRFLRMSSVVIGLMVGYAVAAMFGMVHFNFTSAAINIPQPFKYGIDFNLPAIIGLAVVYFITSIEAVGDITANSSISGMSISDDAYHARVRGGVLADGFNSMVAGVFNSFPNSIFAQNNGLIQLTGVASRHVGYLIAGMLVLLGLFPMVGDLFSTMPPPVLGGATLLMFGMVAAAGIKIIASQQIERRKSLVLALSFALGLGVELYPDVLKCAPVAVKNLFSSGLVTGGVAAILANALIRIKD